ncbi:hypothetical protein GCM10010343_33770 [Streptomyces avidinii]|uniref:DDE family transposase n=1 Tax=Streptomyces avidinii TaxID=1895 RepID=A0ABS4LFZ5_STRAV|nr:hypothetical protein [Streptomyces avidinii]GGZ05306.1 hypothetical protein GCM10010343_33770 [Streptomyces avidinii]
MLLQGTRAERDRVGDSRADYSVKHRRHGVSVQVVTDPGGHVLRVSLELPSRAHELTAARTHCIIGICDGGALGIKRADVLRGRLGLGA